MSLILVKSLKSICLRLRTEHQTTHNRTIVTMIGLMIQMVLLSVAMAQQKFGENDLDGLWFHITSGEHFSSV